MPSGWMAFVGAVASLLIEEGCHSADFHAAIHVGRQFTTTGVPVKLARCKR